MGVVVDFLLSGFTDNSGNPLNGGKVYSYETGTSTPKSLYTDVGLVTPETNPVVLDSNGRKQVYANGTYKLVVKTAADVTLYTFDNLFFVEYATNLAEIAALNSAVSQIVIKSAITLTGNLTLTAPLKIEKGGSIITAGYLLTINGSFEAGLHQVFTAASGEVVFGASALTEVRPEWWGAVHNAADSGTAIGKAIASLPSTGGCVVLPNGLLNVTSEISVSTYGVFIRGAAPVEDTGRTELKYTGSVDSTKAIFRCTAAAQGFCLANVYLNANDLAGYCLYQTGDPTPLNTRGGRLDSITFQGYRSKGWVIGDHTDTLNAAQFQIINAYDLKFTGGGNSNAADAIHVNAQNMEWLNIFGIYIDPESVNVRHHRNHLRQIAGAVNIVGMLSTRAGSSALTTYPAIYSNDQLLINGWRSEDRWLISGAAGEAGGPIHIVGLDQRSPIELASFTVIEINWLERPVHIQASVDGSITIGATNERYCTLDIQFKKAGGAFVFSGPQSHHGIYRDIVTGNVKHMGTAPAIDLMQEDGTRKWAIVDGSLFEPKTQPANITADQNDYALDPGVAFILTANAARSITGILAPSSSGRCLRLFNVTANAITLEHEHASSAAANRIISTSLADIVLAENEGAELWYDSTFTRWRAWKL